MPDQEINRSLMRYRLEKAETCLSSAKALVDEGDYLSAANRSYYAVFHAIRAVLALEGKDFSKHSGVITYFRKQYIKTGLIPVNCSKIIDELFSIRQDSDYRDFFIISKEEVHQQVQSAAEFLKRISMYLQAK